MPVAAWCLLVLLGGAVLSVVYHTLKTGISPLPSSRRAREVMLSEIPNGFSGRIVEAGSGWGSLAVPMARRFPEAAVIGYELSSVPLFCSRLRRLGRCANLRLRRADFLAVSLADADLVVCYLFPGAMRALDAKLRRELRPGARVISNTFALPGWTPVRTHRLPDIFATPIYIYEFTVQSIS
ncbi:MAG TPA: class I SAM-dependent methyltransferase [Acidobacteriota bacterium]|nr:class I SAM-dependent methyltransferase [Acidobacteriota bacterium]HQM64011.1 class I SAM-dependent methyltransferase [Acidobacteriota bacterium]